MGFTSVLIKQRLAAPHGVDPERPTLHRVGSIVLSDGQLELLKWIAVVCMFCDHFGRHLFGLGVESLAYGLGRLAFPLFALVLACNLARPGDRAARAARTMRRLGVACMIATPVAIWARGNPLMLNVFATLGLGAALCWTISTAGNLALRVGLFVILCTAALLVEFNVVGVCIVLAVYVWCAQGLHGAAIFSAALLIALAHLNGMPGNAYGYVGTLAVVPLLVCIARIDVRVPRMTFFFYAIYPAHLALIGALKAFA